MRNVIKAAAAASILALASLSLSTPAAARDNVGAYFGSSGFGIQIGNSRGNSSYYGTPYRSYANRYSNYGYRPSYRYGSYANYVSAPFYGYGARTGSGRERWERGYR